MKGVQLLLGFALLILASSLASAYDPSPLQDICVAIDEPKNAGIYIYAQFLCLNYLLILFAGKAISCCIIIFEHRHPQFHTIKHIVPLNKVVPSTLENDSCLVLM